MNVIDRLRTPQCKLPIGIQSFESLRRDGYLYVDKTAFIYELASAGNPYFLSRPHRFGKSLLLSTLEAYHIYRKLGFKELPEYHTTYERRNIQMELVIKE